MTEILPLLSSLNDDLIKLLKSLKTPDWDRKTIPSGLSIKDISDNLLENNEQDKLDIHHHYSKSWLQQQQIRFALNDQFLLKKAYYFPFLDIIMQALPHAYLNVKAKIGATVKVEIVGEAGGVWSIIKEKASGCFAEHEIHEPDALVYIDQQIAWLLFSKGINPMDAAQYYQLHGDTALGSHALQLISLKA